MAEAVRLLPSIIRSEADAEAAARKAPVQDDAEGS